MGRAWSTKTSAILTTSIAFVQDTDKNFQGKTTVNYESSGGGSRTLAASESAGKSRDSFVISGNSFTDNEFRA
jgi:ABC-type molybdate transport system substrate-binding protein